VWPHFFFLQLVARGGRRACLILLLDSGECFEGCEETHVALSADHLVAVELGGEGLERGLDDTTTETENKVES
jgi:hypothetical protein